MIRSFADHEAEAIFQRRRSRRYSALEKIILRKLLAIHAVEALNDLSVPSGNRLEALKGDRKAQHSIRINDQYRICFRWKDPSDACEVKIVDYH
jgi:proteic killer suppression protein